MRIKHLIVIIAACSITACASTGSKNVTIAPDVQVETKLALKPSWQQKVKYSKKSSSMRQPLLTESKVFVTADKAKVVAYDKVTGEQVWQDRLDSPASAPPAWDNLDLIVATDSGIIYNIDVPTGTLKWQQHLNSAILAQPTIAGSKILLHTLDDKVFALDRTTGTNVWAYSSPAPALKLYGSSAISVTENLALVGFANGKMAALNLDDGSLAWEQHVSVAKGRTELERMVDINAKPLVAGYKIIAASYQGKLAALGQADGAILWQRDLPTYNEIAATQQVVVLTGTDNVVWGLDINTGATLWKQAKLQQQKLSAPVIIGDYVALSDDNGYVYWLQMADGAYVKQQRLDKARLYLDHQPGDKQLLIGSAGGKLGLYDIVG